MMRIFRSKEVDRIATIADARNHLKDSILVQALLWIFPLAAVLQNLSDSSDANRSAIIFLMFTVPVFGTVFGASRALDGFFLRRRFPEVRSLFAALGVTVILAMVGLCFIAAHAIRG
jgi:hypothetical protein